MNYFFVNSLISEEENYEVLSIVQYHEETSFEAQIYSLCKLHTATNFSFHTVTK